jgi:hypothetical protein
MYSQQEKTRPTWHIRFPRQSTCAQRTLPMGGPRTWQPFVSRQQDWTDALLLRKIAPDSTSQPGWVIRGTRLSFSPNTTIESVRLSQAPIDSRLPGLPGPYHRHAIGTFNTCSWVATPQSLTDTGGAYYIETLEYPQHSLSPCLPSVPLIPLNGSARSQIIHTIITNWTGEGINPKSHEWEPPLDFCRNLPSKYRITNGKPPQDGGNKDKLEGWS